MRATTVIREDLAFCEFDLKSEVKKYNDMEQIDMAQNGDKSLEKINKLKGKIIAYTWVLELI